MITDRGMQARMQSVSTCLTSAARPLGALLAGALGTWAGVRPSLITGALLLVVPYVVLARSPLRGLRQMPEAPAPPDPLEAALPAPGRASATEADRERSKEGGTS